jgi:prephenate dehydrogenase
MINAPLWTELFLSNNTELVKHIEIFEKYLDNLKNLISEKNKESLEKNLHEVRKKRIAMNGRK